jgi:hypothetical protein
LSKIAQDMLDPKTDDQAAAELQRRVASLSRPTQTETIPYASRVEAPGVSSSEQKGIEIAGAPSAFGYSGGSGTPGIYGIGQAGIPFYGGVPMMRARGGEASYVHSLLPRMLQAKGYYQGVIDGIAGKGTTARSPPFSVLRASSRSAPRPRRRTPPAELPGPANIPLARARPPDFTGIAATGPPGGPGASAADVMGRVQGTMQAFGSPSGGFTVHGGGLAAHPEFFDAMRRARELALVY